LRKKTLSRENRLKYSPIYMAKIPLVETLDPPELSIYLLNSYRPLVQTHW
jgi:hypothetical protein